MLIVSHGGGGSRQGLRYLGELFAARGFVTVHPTHKGSDREALKAAFPRIRQGLRDMVRDRSNLTERPRDISFVIDSLDKIEARLGGFSGTLDRERIALAGHSFGAYTAMAVAGMKVTLDGETPELADDRVGAFVAMSPQATGWPFNDFTVIEEGAWDGIDRPVLLASGSEDGALGRDADWRKGAWRGLPGGGKYLLWIDGAHHFTFSGAVHRLFHKPDPVHVAIVEDVTFAFVDCHLREREAACSYLESGEADRVHIGAAQVKRK